MRLLSKVIRDMLMYDIRTVWKSSLHDIFGGQTYRVASHSSYWMECFRFVIICMKKKVVFSADNKLHKCLVNCPSIGSLTSHWRRVSDNRLLARNLNLPRSALCLSTVYLCSDSERNKCYYFKKISDFLHWKAFKKFLYFSESFNSFKIEHAHMDMDIQHMY